MPLDRRRVGLRDLLAAFASSDPTPGGIASRAAASVGASLLMMVAGLPQTRAPNPDEDRAALGLRRHC